VLSSGAEPELEEAARQLRAATGAEVLRLDLRDHGLSASRSNPGHVADVDHIGQYDEDVADVLATLRRERPGARIVLAGHSMGGGIALRYAAARRDLGARVVVDGYILFAPLLGEGSPTARREPISGTATPSDPIIKAAVPRIIGLAMLTAARIRWLNGLGTLYFDLPFDLPVRAYTFRAMASMAPDDYRAALKADAKPMLVLVGEKDEAFRAEAYPALIAQHENAKTVLVPGASHDGVCGDPRSLQAIVSWLAESGLREGLLGHGGRELRGPHGAAAHVPFTP
jgi:alpha-beta hydrolase superfamily lysophospholipase